MPICPKPALSLQALDPENDRLLVTALFEQLADYVMLETGEAPSPETIDEFFYDRPPSVEAVDKLLFVIRDGEGKPVGLIDLLRNYPEPSDWYLGFLGIVLDKRGLGLGNAAVNLLKEMVHEASAKRLLLCVLEENPKALAFWQSEGFKFHRATPVWRSGRKTHHRSELIWRFG